MSTLILPKSVCAFRKYVNRHGASFQQPARMRGGSIGVLPELTGKPWDEKALNLVAALRPSWVRVVQGEETTDAILWRVTVYLGEDSLITSVRQEAWVGND